MVVKARGHDAERFDHVVIATHSDQALALLGDATDREHELLGAVDYQPNEAVLHTDTALLPRRRRAWASWNYHLLDEPLGKTAVTYHMNRLQALDADREFCVTLNRTEAIDPDKVIRRIDYSHPVFTAAGEAAQARHHEISGRTAPTSAAPTGAGASTRTASRAACAWPSTSGRGSHDRERHLHRVDPPPPLPGPPQRLRARRRARLSGPRRDPAARRAAALADPRPGIVRFRRADYLGGNTERPARRVRPRRSSRSARAPRPDGPIRLLTHLRTLGHCFNPVSFYYCFDASGERLEAVVAEVTNTPWGERHAYVIGRDQDAGRVIGGESDKVLHVSPFMGMDHRYEWKVGTPGDSLSVHIESHRQGRLAFDATLGMRRSPFNARTLAATTARYPVATGRVLALIYVHALALKLKGVRVHPHPQEGAS